MKKIKISHILNLTSLYILDNKTITPIYFAGEDHTNTIDKYKTEDNDMHYLYFVEQFIKMNSEENKFIDIYIENSIINPAYLGYTSTTLHLFEFLYYKGMLKYLDLTKKKYDDILYEYTFCSVSNLMDNIRIHFIEPRVMILRIIKEELLPNIFKETIPLEFDNLSLIRQLFNTGINLMTNSISEHKFSEQNEENYKILSEPFIKLNNELKNNFLKKIKEINKDDESFFNFINSLDYFSIIRTKDKYIIYQHLENEHEFYVFYSVYLDIYQSFCMLYYLSDDFRDEQYKGKEPCSDYVFGIYGDYHRQTTIRIINFILNTKTYAGETHLTLEFPKEFNSYNEYENKKKELIPQEKTYEYNRIFSWKELFFNFQVETFIKQYGKILYNRIKPKDKFEGGSKGFDYTFGGLMMECEVKLLEYNYADKLDKILKDTYQITNTIPKTGYNLNEMEYEKNYQKFNSLISQEVFGGNVNILNVILIILLILLVYIYFNKYFQKKNFSLVVVGSLSRLI
jgi:hypothetical protein